MLLPDKSNIKDKLKNYLISLKQIEEKKNGLDECYTTDNIVSYKAMVSNYEYTGIPCRTSFMEIDTISNKEYFYRNFNSELPSNNIKWQPIIYTLNNVREIPFLLYLLKNNGNEYTFIDTINKSEKSIEDSMLFLSRTIGLKLQYSGFITNDNVNYLFFEYTNIYKELDGYIWSLVSEIINNEKIYDIKINISLKKILLNNIEIVNIYNVEKTLIYEHPSVCYFLIDKRNEYHLYCGDYNTISNVILNIEQTEKIYYYISRRALFSGIIKCNIDTVTDINKYINYNDVYNSIYNLDMSNVNEISLFINVNDIHRQFELSHLDI